jgi:thioester reductase-like protein
MVAMLDTTRRDQTTVSEDKMKNPGVMVTGFPGFIAGRLMKDLLTSQEVQHHYYFVVLTPFIQKAGEQCAGLESQFPEFKDSWTILEGDIRRRDLGIDAETLKPIRKKIVRLWHLAAVYDLSVPLPFAYGVNVDGTQHVLDFCETLPNFERLLYISTCYVAGKRSGMCYENELDCAQDFKNHYESTKFWAEKLVQHRWDKIPTVIFRPAIVVGDSETGETIKGDGPYVIFQLLMRLPSWLPMVNVGTSKATVNVVPVDFLTKAMATISNQEGALGKVFQLADPNPLQASDIIGLVVEAMDRAPVIGSVPSRWMEALLSVKPIERLVGIQRQAITYFNHPISYDVQNTMEALDGTGVRCPPLVSYLPTLIEYSRRNPNIFMKVQ